MVIKPKTSPNFFCSNPGLFQIVAKICSFIALILVNIGFYNDIVERGFGNDKNPDMVLTKEGYPSVANFGYKGYHHGLGWANDICYLSYFLLLILCYFGTSIWTIFAYTRKGFLSSLWFKKMNPIVNTVAAILMFFTLSLGLTGLINFRKKCCHISLDSWVSSTDEDNGFKELCRCRVYRDINDPGIDALLATDYPSPEAYMYLVLPHHFSNQLFSLVLTAIAFICIVASLIVK